MFSWFTRHVGYSLCLTTAAFRLSKGKGNKIIYISGDSIFFSSALIGTFIGLHSLSFLRLIYPFRFLQSVCRPSFLFRVRRNYYILVWPRNGQDWDRVIVIRQHALSCSPRSPAPDASSFVIALNIKLPRLQAQYFLPGYNEFVLRKKAKKEKLKRNLTQ